MTKNQVVLMRFIASYREKHLKAPTYEEMRAATRVYDKKSVSIMLKSLIRQGMLKKSAKGRSRAIEFTEEGRKFLGLDAVPQDLSNFQSDIMIVPNMPKYHFPDVVAKQNYSLYGESNIDHNSTQNMSNPSKIENTAIPQYFHDFANINSDKFFLLLKGQKWALALTLEYIVVVHILHAPLTDFLILAAFTGLISKFKLNFKI